MCVAAAPALMWASLALTAVSGAYAADSAKKSGQYQANVAAQNAELDEFRATQAQRIGAIEEDKQRAKVRQVVGSQRASLAANGIDLGSGTAEDMIVETETMGEVDALTLRFNAMNEAWGYRTSAVNERNSGKFAKWSGKRQATGTYLSTAASMAGTAAGAYQNGTFGSRTGPSTKVSVSNVRLGG